MSKLQWTRIPCLIGLCALLITPNAVAHADRLRFDSLNQGSQEIGLMFAYGENHKIPEATKDRISFDMLKLRAGRFASPRVEYAGELSVGKAHTGSDNFGWSGTVSGRYYFLVRGGTAFACDMSFGITRFDHRLVSQSTRINFTEQLGITMQVATGPSSALNLKYDFSHTSNAGLKLPNLGINASIVSMGYSWYR